MFDTGSIHEHTQINLSANLKQTQSTSSPCTLRTGLITVYILYTEYVCFVTCVLHVYFMYAFSCKRGMKLLLHRLLLPLLLLLLRLFLLRLSIFVYPRNIDPVVIHRLNFCKQSSIATKNESLYLSAKNFIKTRKITTFLERIPTKQMAGQANRLF